MKKSSLPIIDVGCAIIRKGQQILIAQRKPEDHLGGYWEFPGGKKNSQETLEACLIREVMEELGIAILPIQLLETKDVSTSERILRLHFYLCHWQTGEPRKIECQDFRFIFPHELKAFRFPPADDALIERLIQDQKLFWPES